MLSVMKRMMLSILLNAFVIGIMAQSNTTYETFGLIKSMPVFYEQLKDSLRMEQEKSMKSGISRERIFATMQMAPPAPVDYSYEVIASEQRDGYVAQKIAFNINRWERVFADPRLTCYELPCHSAAPRPWGTFYHR